MENERGCGRHYGQPAASIQSICTYLNWKVNICYVSSFALCMSHCLRCSLAAYNNRVISLSSHIFFVSLKATYLLTYLLTYSMEQSPS
jgi:hypothetical protein